MVYEILLQNKFSADFSNYCHERNVDNLDNMSLYAKIANELGGTYNVYRPGNLCDYISFDSEEDYVFFKLKFQI